jgi:hypothetical protein
MRPDFDLVKRRQIRNMVYGIWYMGFLKLDLFINKKDRGIKMQR